MKKVTAICLALICASQTYAQNVLNCVNPDAMNAWVDSVMATLTPDERLGQLIVPIVDVDDTPEKRNIVLRDVNQYHVGGLLFHKGKIEQQAKMTNLAQDATKVPLMITLDGEWGLFMRLTDAVRYPKNMALGCINHDGEPGNTLRDELMYKYGEEIARQCREMGIMVNFAPVLDINNNPKNPVIGNRSFGDNINAVIAPALSYAAGLEDGGVLSVGKHFPGHGDTDKDSHLTLPRLSHSAMRMDTFEIQPFKEYVRAGFGGIMVAHLDIPSLDKSHDPASISKSIITDILRNRLGFRGLAFTDGMAMKGASSIKHVGTKALLAGEDILLDPVPLPTQWDALKEDIDNGTLPQQLIDEKCRKVLCYKYTLAHMQMESKLMERGYSIGHYSPNAKDLKVEMAGLSQRMHTTQGTELAQELFQESIVLLKNDPNPFDKASPLEPKSLLPSEDLKKMEIIEIKNGRAQTIQQVKQQCSLVKNKPIVLVFYTQPYNMALYADLIGRASAVVLAHEDTPMSHDAVRAMMLGEKAVRGQLCVSIPGLFDAGSGLSYASKYEQEKTETQDIQTPTELLPATPEEVGMKGDVISRIDAIIDDALMKEAFPGCQVLIARKGHIIYNKAFGWYDHTRQRQVTTESIYDLASVSKAAATVPALMIAYDEHRFELEDSIGKYIYECNGTNKGHLTIRQALYHETGMKEGYPFYQMIIDSTSIEKRLYSGKRTGNFTIQQDRNTWFDRRMRWDPYWITTQADNEHSLQVAADMYIRPEFRDTILQKIIDLPLKNEGGYRYSCLNFVLLRHILERTMRQPLDKILEERLFLPMGANSLCFNPLKCERIDPSLLVPTEDDAAIRHQTLNGYVHDEIAAFSGGIEGNAGLFGTATDLAKVLQMMLNGGTFEGREYISQRTCKLFTTTKSQRSRRGLGFDKPAAPPAKSPCVEECPLSTYGHTGYTGTCFWVDPDNQLIYIFLSNRVNPHRWNSTLTKEGYRSQIQSLLYEAMGN